MEVKNHKVINNFIDQKDAAQLIKWIEGIEYSGTSSNHHLTELAKELNGVSHIYDVSNTELTNYIAKYQSITENSKDSVPDLIYDLIARISQESTTTACNGLCVQSICNKANDHHQWIYLIFNHVAKLQIIYQNSNFMPPVGKIARPSK